MSKQIIYFGSTASYALPLATYFDGVNERVNLGTLSNLVSASVGSISLRFKILATGNEEYIFADADGYIKFFTWFGGIRFGIWDGSNKLTNSGAAVSLNTDYQVVCAWSNGSPVKLYLNGALYSNGAANTGNIQVTTFDFSLGAYVNVSNYSNVLINRCEVWNDDLTLAQVQEYYNGGVLKDPTTVSFAANLTHSYRMGNGDTYPTITDRTGIRNGTMVNMAAGNFQNY